MQHKRLKQYNAQGGTEAKRLWPVLEGALCAECKKALATDRHHVDGDRHNNDRNNLRFLCHVCLCAKLSQAHRTGPRSKLTAAQIERIKKHKGDLRDLSKELGFCEGYFKQIRCGVRSPKGADTYETPFVPAHFVRNGPPRALSVAQVKEILSYQPTLGNKNAHRLAKSFNVCLTIIFRARGRYGCYAEDMYN